MKLPKANAAVVRKLLSIAAISIAILLAWIGQQFFSFKYIPMDVAQEQLFVVEKGSSLIQVAHNLKEKGLIAHPRFFSIWGRVRGQAGRLHVGEYKIEPGLTPSQLLERMVEGQVMQYSLTLVEGWTFKQFMQLINAHEKIKHTLSEKSDAQIMGMLGAPGEHPEGRFFPDTYNFPAGISDVEFLKRAYDAMKNYLQSAWQERAKDLPYKNAYEALIMASIIEKETAVPSERNEIAGVFVRRLQKRMRLQTDPTVIYGMGENYDGNIRRRDLKRDTSYNTYTRRGLTPTPIAMPSGESIQAALHPAEGKSLYFVAKGDGSHYFSESLKEHINAVKEFQLKRKK